MQTQLSVNDIIIPLNEFTQRYIGSVMMAIAISLIPSISLSSEGELVGFPDKVCLYIDSENLAITANSEEVPVKKDFSRNIIESTIKGMLSPLKGVVWLERITISTRFH
jgi:hypothetical protein